MVLLCFLVAIYDIDPLIGPSRVRGWTLGFGSVLRVKGIQHMAKAAASKPLTKMQIFNNIAETTELTKKQVAAVFEALREEIGKAVAKKGPGQFTIPDLCKVVRVQKKALPKRQVRNPATGEMIWADARPASSTVRVRPLKKLKDMVE